MTHVFFFQMLLPIQKSRTYKLILIMHLSDIFLCRIHTHIDPVLVKVVTILTLFILIHHTSKPNYIIIIVNTLQCDSICKYLLPLHVSVS
jgi:hypothetical protein